MNAEIITIGTELLLGDIVNTNSAHMTRRLRDVGIDVFFHTTVGDNEDRVASAIAAALARADVVITSGGLGPTVDDVTRQAVACATGRPLEFRPELLEQIAERFRRWGATMSSNNRQQAYVPSGAIVLKNPVGTAPCFIVEADRGAVISLPGVPREMTHILENQVVPYLESRMEQPAVILTCVLRTAGIGESQVDAVIGDLERLSNPTVGLAAHAGQTDIRITAKATNTAQAEEMIEPVAREIRQRLGVHVYGSGTQTVEEVALALAAGGSWSLALAEVGTGGLGAQRLTAAPGFSGASVRVLSRRTWVEMAAELQLEVSASSDDPLETRARQAADRIREREKAGLGLSVLVEQPGPTAGPLIASALSTALGQTARARGYDGPPEYAAPWATTTAFDLVRRWLLAHPPSSGD